MKRGKKKAEGPIQERSQNEKTGTLTNAERAFNCTKTRRKRRARERTREDISPEIGVSCIPLLLKDQVDDAFDNVGVGRREEICRGKVEGEVRESTT